MSGSVLTSISSDCHDAGAAGTLSRLSLKRASVGRRVTGRLVDVSSDSAAGVAHELAGAFEDGAAGGFVSAPGAHSGSALIDDVVSNAATTGAGGGYNAARTWNPSALAPKRLVPQLGW